MLSVSTVADGRRSSGATTWVRRQELLTPLIDSYKSSSAALLLTNSNAEGVDDNSATGKTILASQAVQSLLASGDLTHALWLSFDQAHNEAIASPVTIHHRLLCSLIRALRGIFAEELQLEAQAAAAAPFALLSANIEQCQAYIRNLVNATVASEKHKSLLLVLDGVQEQAEVTMYAYCGLRVLITARNRLVAQHVASTGNFILEVGGFTKRQQKALIQKMTGSADISGPSVRLMSRLSVCTRKSALLASVLKNTNTTRQQQPSSHLTIDQMADSPLLVSMNGCVNVALHRLSDLEKSKVLALGMLPRGTLVPLELAMRLWCMSKQEAVEEVFSLERHALASIVYADQQRVGKSSSSSSSSATTSGEDLVGFCVPCEVADALAERLVSAKGGEELENVTTRSSSISAMLSYATDASVVQSSSFDNVHAQVIVTLWQHLLRMESSLQEACPNGFPSPIEAYEKAQRGKLSLLFLERSACIVSSISPDCFIGNNADRFSYKAHCEWSRSKLNSVFSVSKKSSLLSAAGAVNSSPTAANSNIIKTFIEQKRFDLASRHLETYIETSFATTDELHQEPSALLEKSHALLLLGRCLERRANYVEALGKIEDALACLKLALCLTKLEMLVHPDVLEATGDRTRLLSLIGRPSEAASQLNDDLQTCSNIIADRSNSNSSGDPSTRYVAITHARLGAAYEMSGELDWAQQDYEQSASKFLEMYGSTHPEVQEARTRLALCCITLKENEKASLLLSESLVTGITLLGVEHPSNNNGVFRIVSLMRMSDAKNNEVNLYLTKKLNELSSAEFARNFSKRPAFLILGDHCVALVDTLLMMAETCVRLGNTKDAKGHLKKALLVALGERLDNNSSDSDKEAHPPTLCFYKKHIMNSLLEHTQLARIYRSMGVHFFSSDNLAKSLEYYELSSVEFVSSEAWTIDSEAQIEYLTQTSKRFADANNACFEVAISSIRTLVLQQAEEMKRGEVDSRMLFGPLVSEVYTTLTRALVAQGNIEEAIRLHAHITSSLVNSFSGFVLDSESIESRLVPPIGSKRRFFERLVVDKVDGVLSSYLLAACREENLAAVTLLVSSLPGTRVDLNAADENGVTALDIAVCADLIDIAKILLERGADANAKNPKGETPLTTCCERGQFQMTRLLLQVGKADRNLTNLDARTPLDIARSNKIADLVHLLTHDEAMATKIQSQWRMQKQLKANGPEISKRLKATNLLIFMVKRVQSQWRMRQAKRFFGPGIVNRYKLALLKKAMAIKIQSCMRMKYAQIKTAPAKAEQRRLKLLRTTSCIKLQALFRMYRVRKVAASLIEDRMKIYYLRRGAATKLQTVWRMECARRTYGPRILIRICEKRRARAVTKVTFLMIRFVSHCRRKKILEQEALRRAEKLKGLMSINQKKREQKEEQMLAAKRVRPLILLTAVVRGYLARRRAKKLRFLEIDERVRHYAALKLAMLIRKGMARIKRKLQAKKAAHEAMLLGMAIKIQKIWRMHSARTRFFQVRWAMITLSNHLTAPVKKCLARIKLGKKVAKIQSLWRMYYGKKKYLWKRLTVMALSSDLMGNKVRIQGLRKRLGPFASRIQIWWRYLVVKAEKKKRKEEQDRIEREMVEKLMVPSLPPAEFSDAATSKALKNRRGSLFDSFSSLLTQQGEASSTSSTSERKTRLQVLLETTTSTKEELLEYIARNPDSAKSKTAFGETSLHIALRFSAHPEVVLAIFRLHTEATESINSVGNLPLHVAVGALAECSAEATSGQVDVITALLSAYPHGASCWNRHGNLPLHIAAQSLHVAEVADALLLVVYKLLDVYPEGARIVNTEGDLPLHLCLYPKSPSSLLAKFIELYPEAVYETRDKKGRVALHVALKHECTIDAIQVLRGAHGSRPMEGDGKLFPLHAALYCKASFEVVSFLLKEDPDKVSTPTEDGSFPLHLALREYYPDVNPDLVISLATAYKEAKIVPFPGGAGISPLQFARAKNLSSDIIAALSTQDLRVANDTLLNQALEKQSIKVADSTAPLSAEPLKRRASMVLDKNSPTSAASSLFGQASPVKQQQPPLVQSSPSEANGPSKAVKSVLAQFQAKNAARRGSTGSVPSPAAASAVAKTKFTTASPSPLDGQEKRKNIFDKWKKAAATPSKDEPLSSPAAAPVTAAAKIGGGAAAAGGGGGAAGGGGAGGGEEACEATRKDTFMEWRNASSTPVVNKIENKRVSFRSMESNLFGVDAPPVVPSFDWLEGEDEHASTIAPSFGEDICESTTKRQSFSFFDHVPPASEEPTSPFENSDPFAEFEVTHRRKSFRLFDELVSKHKPVNNPFEDEF